MINEYVNLGIKLISNGLTIFIVGGAAYLIFKAIKLEKDISKKDHSPDRYCEYHNKKIYSWEEQCSYCKDGNFLPWQIRGMLLEKIKNCGDEESEQIRNFITNDGRYRKKIKDRYKLIDKHENCKILGCVGCKYEMLVNPLNDLWETKNILAELDEPITQIIITKYLDPDIKSKEILAQQYLDKYKKAIK